ncbi:MAG: hypothetical protein M1812_004909 [Candelaria pacifica]|nr:MAG: hypothetical protein M1812_004909 [Candelaria pacifica]
MVCGPFYGTPTPNDCRILIYRLLPQGDTVASFGLWGPPLSSHGTIHYLKFEPPECSLSDDALAGACTIEIEHRALPSGDTVTWAEADAAVERILGFCTVPTKGLFGGVQAIGENENILISVSGPRPDIDDEDFEMIQVGSASLIGDTMDVGSGALHPSKKRKCRDEGTGNNYLPPSKKKSLCADTCNDGKSLSRGDLMFGMKGLTEWTIFFCESVMAGIVEIGGGS